MFFCFLGWLDPIDGDCKRLRGKESARERERQGRAERESEGERVRIRHVDKEGERGRYIERIPLAGLQWKYRQSSTDRHS